MVTFISPKYSSNSLQTKKKRSNLNTPNIHIDYLYAESYVKPSEMKVPVGRMKIMAEVDVMPVDVDVMPVDDDVIAAEGDVMPAKVDVKFVMTDDKSVGIDVMYVSLIM